MKPKEAFGKGGYGCVPRQMHPAWQRIGYYARALGRDLLSMVDDFETLELPTSGDWRSSLCMTLCVNGRNDRRNAKAALDELLGAGLLDVEDGSVVIRLHPSCGHGAATVRPCAHSGVFNSSQVTVTTQLENDSQSVSQSVEDRVRVPARETVDQVIDLKPPVQTSSPASKRAADKLYALTLRWYDPRSEEHREALEALGERSEEEWARALETIEREMTKPGVAGMMTPSHLLAKWGKYSNGEAPVGRAEIQRRLHERKPSIEASRYPYRDSVAAGGK